MFKIKKKFIYNEIIIKHKKNNSIEKTNEIFYNSFTSYSLENKNNESLKKPIMNEKDNTINFFRKKDCIIKAEYKIEKKKNKKNIKIFGNTFVKNNRIKFYILNNGKKYSLEEHFNIENNIKKTLKIKIIRISYAINLEQMFFSCSSLKSIKGISNLDTSKVINLSCFFINALL